MSASSRKALTTSNEYFFEPTRRFDPTDAPEPSPTLSRAVWTPGPPPALSAVGSGPEVTCCPLPASTPALLGSVAGQDLPKHLSSDGPSREFSMLTYKEQRLYVARKSTRAAHAEKNRCKNRYSNVVPYDDTRVVLVDAKEGDYINASFVDGETEGAERAYIATQGPLPQTFGDFWRMVQESGARVVVMLGKEREKEKVKVDKYWPGEVGETVVYGKVAVRLVAVRTKEESSITLRTLEVAGCATPEETRLVYHYQYSGWPDNGAPTTTKHVRELIQMIYKHLGTPVEVHALSKVLPRPLVVHCFTTEHQVLTSRGFMFLAEIQKAAARDPCLRVAAYDPETRRVVYEPFRLVVNQPRKRQRMVEVSHEKSGISVVVTRGHDMFASRASQGGSHFGKVKAKELLRSTWRNAGFRLLTAAEGGVSQAETTPSVAAELGLQNAEQLCAFAALYGFWIGVSLTTCRSRIDLGSLVGEVARWVERQLIAIGHEGCLSSGRVEIAEESWARFFFAGGTDKKTRKLGDWVWELGRDCSRALLRGLVVAECGVDEMERELLPSVVVQSARLRDDLLRLCLHCGFCASFTDSPGGRWAVTFDRSREQKEPMLPSGSPEVREVEYDGVTWCVTVPHGLIFVRRALVTESGGTVAKASTPLVVGNCSAGIGRTGAFCAIHITIEKMRERWDKREPLEFNLFQTVLRLRKARAGMVQQLEQYTFCYETILDEALEIGLIQGTPRFRVYSSGLSRGVFNLLTKSGGLWPTGAGQQPPLSPKQDCQQLTLPQLPATEPVAVPHNQYRAALLSIYGEEESSGLAFVSEGLRDELECSHSLDETISRRATLFDEYESDPSEMDVSQESTYACMAPGLRCSRPGSTHSTDTESTDSTADELSDGRAREAEGSGDTDMETDDGFVIVGKPKRDLALSQIQPYRGGHQAQEAGQTRKHRHRSDHDPRPPGQQPQQPRDHARTPPPGQVLLRKRSNSVGPADTPGRCPTARRPSRSQMSLQAQQQQQQQTKTRSNSALMAANNTRQQDPRPNRSLSRTLTVPPSLFSSLSGQQSPNLTFCQAPPFTASMPVLPPPVRSPPHRAQQPPSSPVALPQAPWQQVVPSSSMHASDGLLSIAPPPATSPIPIPNHPPSLRRQPTIKLLCSPPSPTRTISDRR